MRTDPAARHATRQEGARADARSVDHPRRPVSPARRSKHPAAHG